MSVESFVLLRVDNREVTGVAPSVHNAEQAIVTVQSQGVYLYNVRVNHRKIETLVNRKKRKSGLQNLYLLACDNMENVFAATQTIGKMNAKSSREAQTI